MSKRFYLVTGPSGGGKSEYSRQQIDWQHRLYNLDDWARTRGSTEDPDVRESAWTALLADLYRNLSAGGTPIALDHVADASCMDDIVNPVKQRGYEIDLFVICPGRAEVCVQRVRHRKREGGHGRSEGAIRQLYESSMLAASELSLVCDRTTLIDSGGEAFERVAEIERYWWAFRKEENCPPWVDEYFDAPGAQAGLTKGPHL